MHTHHATAALVHVAHDIAHERIGYGDFQIANGLKKYGSGLLKALSVCQVSGGLEGHFVGVNGMEATVVQLSLQANQRETDSTLGHGVLKTFLDSGDKVLGHGAANGGIHEGQTLVFTGSEADLDVTVLTGTAVLLLVLAFDVALLGDGLTVSDLGLIQLDVGAEAGLQLSGQNRQVHIADTVNEHLLGLGIVFVTQGQILFQHLSDGLRDLGLVLGGLGGDTLAHIRRCVLGRSVYGIAAETEGVAGVGVCELGDHTEITASQLFDLDLLLALHDVDVRHLFGCAGTDVAERHVAAEYTGHDLEEGHLTHERVSDGLVNEDGGIAFHVDGHGLVAQILLHLTGGRTGEGACDGIQHSDNAPHVGGRAAVYGDNGTLNDTVVECFLGLFFGKGFTLEVLHHQVVGGTCQSLVECVLIVVRGLLPVDLHGNAVSLALFVVLEGLHIDQVDHGNVLAGLHGDKYGTDGHAEGCMDLVEDAGELGLGIVALIDKESLGNTGSTSSVPRKLGTNLNACLTVNRNDGGIGHTDSLLDFACEIQEAGGIQNVDLGILPSHVSGGSGQRKASCLFLCVIVADGVTLGNVTETVDTAGCIQHCLNQRGLTAAAMTQEGQVTNLLGVEISHGCSPLSAHRTPSSPRDGTDTFPFYILVIC